MVKFHTGSKVCEEPKLLCKLSKAEYTRLPIG